MTYFIGIWVVYCCRLWCIVEVVVEFMRDVVGRWEETRKSYGVEVEWDFHGISCLLLESSSNPLQKTICVTIPLSPSRILHILTSIP